MIQSMTGFGTRELKDDILGKISVELRSTNHKFLETVLHLPEGFLLLEDGIKKELESRLKRGRVTCVVTITGTKAGRVFINYDLINEYIAQFKKINQQCKIKDNITLDTLIKLPGVLSLEDNKIDKAIVWPKLKNLLSLALADLLKMRQREGAALQVFLRKHCQVLGKDLEDVKSRFKKVVKERKAQLDSKEDVTSFLKDVDISEETDRLSFHVKNFLHKLHKKTAVGKELDFIAQEMQRECNTAGAKSCDTVISAKVIQMKSQIEKIREQVQNIE